ncbi:diacylglyceryl transferase [Paenibacillus darwinianus]|uniref:Phosphatidylglycerol--prolipoprotein diacylglyceryl transferase n=1 Tax=Paenibacillus darwinianus TaxID=1380763 RepID=A0A9W5W6V2_9BACL|nr:prolipoprotein diacylglyceryl transferase [Paenibacillus darwinianus]EXX87830.1 diacylglyceryl transferase [Paenibacillus darwinianus]
MIGFEVFTIFGISVPTHGLGIALAALLAILLIRRQARLSGMNPELILDFATYALIAGVLGARIWYVIFSWEYYAADPLSILRIWEGGLALQGGLAGGIIAGIWFARKNKLPVWSFADIVAPGLILGMAIGRIGDFMAGDDFGIVSESFGVVYKPGTMAYEANGPLPLFPTALFEAAADLIIMGVILALRKQNVFKGFLFLFMLITYSIARFFLEFTRGDSLMTFFNLRTAQVTSVVTIIIALIFLYIRVKQTRSQTRTE